MEENSLVASIAALQAQITGVQANMNFLLESVRELKGENANRRTAIDEFAVSTRDRLSKIESDVGLGRWVAAILVGAILALSASKIYQVLQSDANQVEQIIKK
jgi:hypothetical protein